jgi:hypothetical protein
MREAATRRFKRDVECTMKATNFRLEAPAMLGAWVGFWSEPKSTGARKPDAKAPQSPKLGLLERFDRWLWRQHVREREAYLAESKDIFELEERIRVLERSVGSCYY